jgi:uncharacterized lipoprotein YmbA
MALTAAGALALSGCIGFGTTRETRLYVLSSLTPADAPGTRAEEGMAIGVGPVTIPGYLNRPPLMWRNGPNELQLAEFAQWAEPLQENVARVLGNNLGLLVPTDRVSLFPFPSFTPVETRVEVEITRFGLEPDRSVSLAARWRLVGANGRELLPRRKSFYRVESPGPGHAASVAAMSEALARLSRDIADAMRAPAR